MPDYIMASMLIYAALELESNGYNLYLLREGTKQHAYRNPRLLSRGELQTHLRRGIYNLGIALGDGLMCVDRDGEQRIEGLESPGSVLTSRGTHDYFRVRKEISNQINFNDMKIDLLFHGYAVAPPSIISATEHRYTWKNGIVPRDQLPFFPEELLPSPIRSDIPLVRYEPKIDVRNPEAYCLKIPSIQGEGGSRGLVRAVCRMRDAGRSSVETYEFLTRVWNPQCAVPPWSDEEIRRAVERHFQRR